jgi:hypothetical protein
MTGVTYDSLFGEPAQSGVPNAQGALLGAVPAFSHAPYEGDVERDARKCIGNDDTCEGWKSGGTDYCAGHRRGQK